MKPSLSLNPFTLSLRKCGLAFALPALLPALAWANPTGGSVVAGAASISTPNAATTVINQTSGSAVVNWQQFSIGNQELVQFVQPSASAAILNRVVGGMPSEILGNLTANGRVFLINPQGILFSKTATVDVGGLFAGTMNIDDGDFMAGRYVLTNAAQGSGVINQGVIRAADGGFVVLAAEAVDNSGVVSAPHGTAALAAGKGITLDLTGDGLVSVQVSGAALADAAGVRNSGQVLADGGKAVLAARVSDLAATAVNNSGLVRATGIAEKNGQIVLEGLGGSITNSGIIDASSATSQGGDIDIRSSKDITLAPSSQLLALGTDGGVIRVVADNRLDTTTGSLLDARALSAEGKGGFAELSGYNGMVFEGTTRLGAGGYLLLDPANVRLESSVNNNCASQTVCFTSGEIVSTMADGTDVGLVATQTITVDLTNADGSPGSLVSPTTASFFLGIGSPPARSLPGTKPVDFVRGDGTPNGSTSISFLNAADTISVGGNLTIIGGSDTTGTVSTANLMSGGNLAITAAGGVYLNGNLTAGGSLTVTNESAGSIYTSGANIAQTLSAAGGNITIGDVGNPAGNLVLRGAGLGLDSLRIQNISAAGTADVVIGNVSAEGGSSNLVINSVSGGVNTGSIDIISSRSNVDLAAAKDITTSYISANRIDIGQHSTSNAAPLSLIHTGDLTDYSGVAIESDNANILTGNINSSGIASVSANGQYDVYLDASDPNGLASINTGTITLSGSLGSFHQVSVEAAGAIDISGAVTVNGTNDLGAHVSLLAINGDIAVGDPASSPNAFDLHSDRGLALDVTALRGNISINGATNLQAAQSGYGSGLFVNDPLLNFDTTVLASARFTTGSNDGSILGGSIQLDGPVKVAVVNPLLFTLNNNSSIQDTLNGGNALLEIASSRSVTVGAPVLVSGYGDAVFKLTAGNTLTGEANSQISLTDVTRSNGPAVGVQSKGATFRRTDNNFGLNLVEKTLGTAALIIGADSRGQTVPAGGFAASNASLQVSGSLIALGPNAVVDVSAEQILIDAPPVSTALSEVAAFPPSILTAANNFAVLASTGSSPAASTTVYKVVDTCAGGGCFVNVPIYSDTGGSSSVLLRATGAGDDPITPNVTENNVALRINGNIAAIGSSADLLIEGRSQSPVGDLLSINGFAGAASLVQYQVKGDAHGAEVPGEALQAGFTNGIAPKPRLTPGVTAGSGTASDPTISYNQLLVQTGEASFRIGALPLSVAGSGLPSTVKITGDALVSGAGTAIAQFDDLGIRVDGSTTVSSDPTRPGLLMGYLESTDPSIERFVSASDDTATPARLSQAELRVGNNSFASFGGNVTLMGLTSLARINTGDLSLGGRLSINENRAALFDGNFRPASYLEQISVAGAPAGFTTQVDGGVNGLVVHASGNISAQDIYAEGDGTTAVQLFAGGNIGTGSITLISHNPNGDDSISNTPPVLTASSNDTTRLGSPVSLASEAVLSVLGSGTVQTGSLSVYGQNGINLTGFNATVVGNANFQAGPSVTDQTNLGLPETKAYFGNQGSYSSALQNFDGPLGDRLAPVPNGPDLGFLGSSVTTGTTVLTTVANPVTLEPGDIRTDAYGYQFAADTGLHAAGVLSMNARSFFGGNGSLFGTLDLSGNTVALTSVSLYSYGEPSRLIVHSNASNLDDSSDGLTLSNVSFDVGNIDLSSSSGTLDVSNSVLAGHRAASLGKAVSLKATAGGIVLNNSLVMAGSYVNPNNPPPVPDTAARDASLVAERGVFIFNSSTDVAGTLLIDGNSAGDTALLLDANSTPFNDVFISNSGLNYTFALRGTSAALSQQAFLVSTDLAIVAAPPPSTALPPTGRHVVVVGRDPVISNSLIGGETVDLGAEVGGLSVSGSLLAASSLVAGAAELSLGSRSGGVTVQNSTIQSDGDSNLFAGAGGINLIDSTVSGTSANSASGAIHLATNAGDVVIMGSRILSGGIDDLLSSSFATDLGFVSPNRIDGSFTMLDSANFGSSIFSRGASNIVLSGAFTTNNQLALDGRSATSPLGDEDVSIRADGALTLGFDSIAGRLVTLKGNGSSLTGTTVIATGTDPALTSQIGNTGNTTLDGVFVDAAGRMLITSADAAVTLVNGHYNTDPELGTAFTEAARMLTVRGSSIDLRGTPKIAGGTVTFDATGSALNLGANLDLTFGQAANFVGSSVSLNDLTLKGVPDAANKSVADVNILSRSGGATLGNVSFSGIDTLGFDLAGDLLLTGVTTVAAHTVKSSVDAASLAAAGVSFVLTNRVGGNVTTTGSTAFVTDQGFDVTAGGAFDTTASSQGSSFGSVGTVVINANTLSLASDQIIAAATSLQGSSGVTLTGTRVTLSDALGSSTIASSGGNVVLSQAKIATPGALHVIAANNLQLSGGSINNPGVLPATADVSLSGGNVSLASDTAIFADQLTVDATAVNGVLALNAATITYREGLFRALNTGGSLTANGATLIGDSHQFITNANLDLSSIVRISGTPGGVLQLLSEKSLTGDITTSNGATAVTVIEEAGGSIFLSGTFKVGSLSATAHGAGVTVGSGSQVSASDSASFTADGAAGAVTISGARLLAGTALNATGFDVNIDHSTLAGLSAGASPTVTLNAANSLKVDASTVNAGSLNSTVAGATTLSGNSQLTATSFALSSGGSFTANVASLTGAGSVKANGIALTQANVTLTGAGTLDSGSGTLAAANSTITGAGQSLGITGNRLTADASTVNVGSLTATIAGTTALTNGSSLTATSFALSSGGSFTASLSRFTGAGSIKANGVAIDSSNFVVNSATELDALGNALTLTNSSMGGAGGIVLKGNSLQLDTFSAAADSLTTSSATSSSVNNSSIAVTNYALRSAGAFNSAGSTISGAGSILANGLTANGDIFLLNGLTALDSGTGDLALTTTFLTGSGGSRLDLRGANLSLDGGLANVDHLLAKTAGAISLGNGAGIVVGSSAQLNANNIAVSDSLISLGGVSPAPSLATPAPTTSGISLIAGNGLAISNSTVSGYALSLPGLPAPATSTTVTLDAGSGTLLIDQHSLINAPVITASSQTAVTVQNGSVLSTIAPATTAVTPARADTLRKAALSTTSITLNGGDITLANSSLLGGDVNLLANAGTLSLSGAAVSGQNVVLTANRISSPAASTLIADSLGSTAAVQDFALTTLTLGTGTAPFGGDAALLALIRAVRPDLLPSVATPNASFNASTSLVLGTVNGTAHYIEVRTASASFTAPVRGASDLFLNLSPVSDTQSFAITNLDFARNNVGVFALGSGSYHGLIAVSDPNIPEPLVAISPRLSLIDTAGTDFLFVTNNNLTPNGEVVTLLPPEFEPELTYDPKRRRDDSSDPNGRPIEIIRIYDSQAETLCTVSGGAP